MNVGTAVCSGHGLYVMSEVSAFGNCVLVQNPTSSSTISAL